MAKYRALFSTPGALQAVTVLLAAAIVSLFPVLSNLSLILPTRYGLKTTQQIVNFLVPVIAIGLGILFKDCLGRTNEAESALALDRSSLTLGRLEMHTAAARESLLKLTTGFFRVKAARGRACLYMCSLLAFAALTWVLSIVFVVEIQTISPNLFWNQSLSDLNGERYEPRHARLPADIPDDTDACNRNLGSPNCTYVLSVAPLSSMLVTHTPYHIAGVRFHANYQGPRGIPYDFLEQFVEEPLLLASSTRSHITAYEYVPITRDDGTYVVTVDPDTPYAYQVPRVSGDNGTTTTWTIVNSRHPNKTRETVISEAGPRTNLLSQLMYGTNATSNITTVVCTLDTRWYWSWTLFRYSNNTFQVGAPGVIPCSNDLSLSWCEYLQQYPAYKNLEYAIEGATTVFSSISGYSKYINRDPDYMIDSAAMLANPGQIIYSNVTYLRDYAESNGMTELEVLLSAIYGVVTTMHSSTQKDVTPTSRILKVTNRHYYQVTVDWTAITIVAAVAASAIFICTVWQAACWARATILLGGYKPDRDLTQPLNLMAYSTLVVEDLKAMMADDEEKKLRARGEDKVKFGPNGVVYG
ncbi:hypothetical protein H2201_008989 [Coniosporium apollinis]|uniref:Uncharacterized protein n=1 Tax=Coniosporium apollinis TaxID=61459 RepID=A0ABQ9NI06_9PEZI|nr:hypothetical protein H2201_008989 [Coniosporium apollinis]